MELNAAAGTNDLVRGLTTVTYGGTLSLSNLGGAITASNAFKLFSANSYSRRFRSDHAGQPRPGPRLEYQHPRARTERFESSAPRPR